MFDEIDKNIFTADPFIYRIDPEDYISITESLLIDRKLFQEVDKAKKSLTTGGGDTNLFKKYSSILKRWKTSRTEKIEKLYEDLMFTNIFTRKLERV